MVDGVGDGEVGDGHVRRADDHDFVGRISAVEHDPELVAGRGAQRNADRSDVEARDG